MIGIIIGAIALIAIICSFAWYRIVDPSEAHLVATANGKFVVSSDENVGDRKMYFAVPGWIPFFGRAIRQMDVTIKEILNTQETIEKNQARYNVTSSTKYRITNVRVAAETFITDMELKKQLTEIIRAGVRAITVMYDVQTARAKKREMEEKIRNEISDDFKKWGLTLINFQLVEFKDTENSHIISNISIRSEVEIESKTREQKAEKIKQARMKEAEAEESARKREIAKDKVIAEQEQDKAKFIAVKEQDAEKERYKVIKIRTIQQAEIDKEKAIVLANQMKETEAIKKEQKKLEGEGDRLKAEEKAKGEAAPILEKGLAEAKAKDALQKALNLFSDAAIRALVAEKIVAKDEAVGVATAKALENADLKVFAGGDSDKPGFDLGKIIASTSVADSGTAHALLNKMGRPNDMGFMALGLKNIADTKKNEPVKEKETKTETKKESEDVTIGDITNDIKNKNFGKAVDDFKHVTIGQKRREFGTRN